MHPKIISIEEIDRHYARNGPGGFGTLIGLQPEQERYLLTEIEQTDPTRRSMALGFVGWLILQYAYHREMEELERLHGNPRDNAERAVQALQEAQNALRGLGPSVMRFVTGEGGRGDDQFLAFTFEIDHYVKDLQDFLRRYQPRAGRRNLSALEDAVFEAVLIYRWATGKEPGVPSIRTSKNDTAEPTGPFYRFCSSVLRVVKEPNASEIENMIRKVLRAEKKSRQKSPIIPSG